MLTLPEALAAARAAMVAWLPADAVLLADSAQETPYAWVIYWTTGRWLASRNPLDAPVGVGPFIVAKPTGRVTACGSAYTVATALEHYEEENQLYGLRVTADLASPPILLLLKHLAQLSPSSLLALVRTPAAWVAGAAAPACWPYSRIGPCRDWRRRWRRVFKFPPASQRKA